MDVSKIHLGGRSGGLVFPCLEEYSTVCGDPNKSREDS